jgi:hypothetical protein
MRFKRYMIGLAIAAGLVATGCGQGQKPAIISTNAKSPAKPTPTPVATPIPQVTFNMPRRIIVEKPHATILGTVTPATATVNIAGRHPKVHADGSFSTSIRVKLGSRQFYVNGNATGYKDSDFSLVQVIRRRSQAEIVRHRAAVKARRIQHVVNFKANAKTIPYNQLHKDADAHAGEHVKFYGQIMQIQEEGNSGIMLLSVTDEGYGLWTDNVWVNYTGRVKGAEDDMLTVYGTVVGSKSYETQIGGETYVPEINAKYIEE